MRVRASGARIGGAAGYHLNPMIRRVLPTLVLLTVVMTAGPASAAAPSVEHLRPERIYGRLEELLTQVASSR